jgi:hypothetical protein
MAELHNRSTAREGWRYRSVEAMVLDLGRPFEHRPRPRGSGVRLGRMKECYRNSTNASLGTGFAYCEGFAVSRFFPMAHAWIAPTPGVAWETTWRNCDDAEYFGIPWQREFMIATMARTKHYGVFGSGDWKFIAELLRFGPPAGSVAS